MDFTSRQLRAFLLVAQHRSFTRAAAALFITPSGLSVLIRELETQLGFRLFDRTTRHVALTTDGSELLPIVREHLQELDTTMSRIGRTAEASQTLSVGAPPLFAANILLQARKEFQRQRPDLHIRIFDGTLASVRDAVQAGQLDLGVGNFGPVPGLRRMLLFRFSLMVVRPERADAPGFRPASTTWSALKGETLIVGPSTSPLQQLIERHLAKARVVARDREVFNSLDMQIAMVEAEYGIGVVPSYAMALCRNRRVVMSRLINPVVTMDFHQIQHRGKKLPSVAEEFTAFLQAYVGRWAGSSGIV